MEEEEEDEEMEQDPGPMPGTCDICKSILRDQRNRTRLDQNQNKKTAQEERHRRRQAAKENIAKIRKHIHDTFVLVSEVSTCDERLCEKYSFG